MRLLRLKLADLLFKLGKRIHPDICSPQRQIDKAYEDIVRTIYDNSPTVYVESKEKVNGHYTRRH